MFQTVFSGSFGCRSGGHGLAGRGPGPARAGAVAAAGGWSGGRLEIAGHGFASFPAWIGRPHRWSLAPRSVARTLPFDRNKCKRLIHREREPWRTESTTRVSDWARGNSLLVECGADYIPTMVRPGENRDEVPSVRPARGVLRAGDACLPGLGMWYLRQSRGGAGIGLFHHRGALLEPGDLVYVRTRAGEERRPGARAAAVSMALIMVRAGARGSVPVRLVQDFRPDRRSRARTGACGDRSAGRRRSNGRGRPPGSRNRRNGAISATQLN